MQGYFAHHPDGFILVEDMVIPLDRFMAFEPGYTGLPAGVYSMDYQQNVRHTYTDGANVIGGGPVPWPEGDAYIANKAVYQDKLNQEKLNIGFDAVQAQQAAAVSSACSQAITGGFTSSALGAAYTYPSAVNDQQNLASSILDSILPGNANDPAYTTPFWCCDSSGVWAWTPHTAVQIQQVGKDMKAAILDCQAKNAQLQAQIKAVSMNGQTEAQAIAQVKAIIW